MDEPPRPESDPEPGPSSGPPESGWVVPARDAPGRPPSRGVTVLMWLAALLFAGFAAWLNVRAAEGSDGYRAGVAVGAFLAPFLFSAILRLVVTRIRWGRFDRAALRSHWVPLGAMVLVVLSTLGNLDKLALPAPVEASTAMHVSAPFTLREADAATVAEVEGLLTQDVSIRSVAVRHVVGDDGSVSLLVAADGRLRDGGISEVARGMATGPNGVIASWIDSPLLLSVYAVDLTTLRAVVESVIESG